MRSRDIAGMILGLTVGAAASACTIDPPAGTPPAPMAGALEGGPREAAFGRTGPEVVNNPQLRDNIRQMFGSDWGPGGKLVRGAEPFFGRTEPPRGIRIGDRNYIAVTGCAPDRCQADRVLLLIQESGESLLARLDEGGFSHYYAYGGNWGLAGSTAQAADSGLRALQRTGDPYPKF
jgi:hypothetical protein